MRGRKKGDSRNVEEINVREFGAKGDGKTDDTAALNAAFEEMRRRSMVTHPDLPRQWGGPEWFPGTCPAVMFPCGHYRISDAIDISGRFTSLLDRELGAHAIRGDNAVIDQTNPEKDLFVSTYSNMTHTAKERTGNAQAYTPLSLTPGPVDGGSRPVGRPGSAVTGPERLVRVDHRVPGTGPSETRSHLRWHRGQER
jgi:hypothetical protein